ncbi:glycosyltransferase [Nocardia takedensis]
MDTASGGIGAIGIYAWCTDLERTPGGLESYVAHLARFLAAAGRQVVVHCLAGQSGGWHVRDGEFRIGSTLTEVDHRLWAFTPLHGPGTAGAVAEHRAISARFNETLVFAIGTREGYIFDIAAAVARERDLPAVASYNHATDERRFRAQFTTRGAGVAALADAEEAAAFERDAEAVIRRIAVQFDAVVVPTEYVRGQFSALLSAADQARVVVAYHGTGAEMATPRPSPWTGEGPWLHVSRCAVPNALNKNFLWSCEFVVAALAAGSPVAERAHLRMCGGGNATSIVSDFAAQTGSADRITMVGEARRHELALLYRQSSFLLVPSMMEAGSMTLVEAVLSGCVPVVLDFAGSGEIMRELGLGALLVPARGRSVPALDHSGQVCARIEFVQPDTEAALEVVRRCLHDPEGTNAAMVAAADIARAKFTTEPTARLLDQVLRRRSRRLGLLPIDR